LAKSTKSIRINQLAKELNVSSALILEKLRKEGLGDVAANHQSAVQLGLAETIREWFHHHAGASTAVETAAPVVETPEKPKRGRKKKGEEGEGAEAVKPAPAHVEAAVEPAVPPIEEAQPAPAPEPAIEAAAPEQPISESAVVVAQPPVPAAAEAPAPVTVPAPEERTPQQPPTEAPKPEIAAEPAAEPVAQPAAAVEVAPETAAPSEHVKAPAKAHGPARHVPRSTTLPHQPAKRMAKPAVFTPEPAKIQGPRVVRVEKEEVVNIGPNRARGPRAQGNDGPTITPAAPRGGRGVKVSDAEEDEAEKAKKAKSGRSLSSRRRGADGRRGEALEKLKEYTDADLLERQERLAAAAGYRSNFDSHLKRHDKTPQGKAKTIVQRGEPVAIEEPITVRSLAAALGLKTNDIIGKLMRQSVFATVNQSLDLDTAQALALEWGLELTAKQQATAEEVLMDEFSNRDVDVAKLVARPPVVTILGHVDHGKTSLLDKIRNANVAAGEAGGITQHTAAWMVEVQAESGAKRVTFIDTPGHQAFTAMRARGADMTDVVVLVVSAAEGVQPQTIESINHAKAAGVPIVVALNKIDRADANPDMVLGQLAKEGLNPVEWGGDTEVVRTSATTGAGIKDLIEMLDYQAELLQLKTDPTGPVRGSVIESRMDEGLGPVATVLVQDGTLKPGDVLLVGSTFGKVRRLLNDRGEALKHATASMPVVVSGLSGMPDAGDKAFQVDDVDRARMICEDRAGRDRMKDLATKNPVSLENLLETIKQEDMKEVRLIIKADVAGSVETLAKTVVESSSAEVRIRVIHAAAGPINESDVELADASKAVIIGFNVVPDDTARAMAEQRRIEVRLYRVIYEILDDLKKAMSGMLEPEIREKYHGRAEIRQVFKVSRLGNIAGCMVIDGHIQRGSKIRLIRNGAIVVQDQALESLRRAKDDVKEVKQGFECGMKLSGYDDIKVGDIFEAYIRETIQRTL